MSKILWTLLLIPCISVAQQVSEDEVNREEKFIQASQLMLLSKYEEALVILKDLEKQNPLNGSVHYTLAKVYSKLDKPEDAIRSGRKAVSIDKTNPWFHLQLADLHISQKDYVSAADVYSILAEQKKDRELYSVWAELLIKAGNREAALRVIERSEEIFGYDDKISDSKIELLLSMNEPGKAEKYLLKWTEARPFDVLLFQKLAALYQYLKKFDDALEVYRRIVELDPRNEIALYQIRSVEAVRSDDRMLVLIQDPAVSLDSKIKSLIPFIQELQIDNSEEKINRMDLLTQKLVELYPEQAKAHAIRGDLLTQKGLLQEANQSYFETIARVKSVFGVWENLMINLAEIEDYQKLAEISAEAMDYYPNQASVYLFNALSNYKQKKYQEAMEVVLEAKFASNPKDYSMQIQIQLLRTRIALDQNQSKGALSLLEELVTNWADQANAGQNEEIADLFLILEQKEKAMDHYKRALELGGERSRLTTKMASI